MARDYTDAVRESANWFNNEYPNADRETAIDEASMEVNEIVGEMSVQEVLDFVYEYDLTGSNLDEYHSRCDLGTVMRDLVSREVQILLLEEYNYTSS